MPPDASTPAGDWSDFDDNEEWNVESAPRHRPRAIRAIGILAMVSLVVATVGGTVGVLFLPSSNDAFPSALRSAGIDRSSVSPNSILRSFRVNFEVTNPGQTASTAICHVSFAKNGISQSGAYLTGPLAPHVAEPESVTIGIIATQEITNIQVNCIAGS